MKQQFLTSDVKNRFLNTNDNINKNSLNEKINNNISPFEVTIHGNVSTALRCLSFDKLQYIIDYLYNRSKYINIKF